MKTKLLFIILINFILLSHVQAQFVIGASGGPFIETGRAAGSYHTGLMGNVDLMFFAKNVKIGVETSVGTHKVKPSSLVYSNGPVRSTVRETYLPSARVSWGLYFDKEPVVFYGDFGVGVYRSELSGSLVADHSEMSFSGSSVDFGIAPRAGLIYMINSKFGIDMNIRYDRIFSEDKYARKRIAFSDIAFNFGIVFTPSSLEKMFK